MRGRKPKPTHQHAIDGTRPSVRRTGEPQPINDIGLCPAHLNAAQATLWNYYVEQAPAGLLKAVDRATLEAFVVALDVAMSAADIIRREGIVVVTDKGTVEHAASRVLARYTVIVHRLGAELGFSPSSRPRISVKPPEAPENPWAAFGAYRRAPTESADVPDVRPRAPRQH